MSKHAALAICLKDRNRIPREQSLLMVCDDVTNKYDEKNTWRWQLPGGKCCDDKLKMVDCCSEKPEDTVIREFKEETGFDARIEKFLFDDERVNPESREKFRRYVYLVRITGGEALQNIVPGGQTSPKRFKLGAMPRNSFKSHQEVILRYFKENVLV